MSEELDSTAGVGAGENPQASAEASPAADPAAAPSAGTETPATILSGSAAQGNEEAPSDSGATADGKPEEGSEEKPDGAEKTDGAPEEYGTFNAPEGIELADPVLDVFKGAAKDLNLSQKQAQSLIDKMGPALRDRAIENIRTVSAEWTQRSMSDEEIGGERMKTTQANISRMLQRFGKTEGGKMDPDIAEFISLPIGNHPGALKLLARAGAAFGEAKVPTGGASSTPYTAEDFYKDAYKGGR